MSNLHDPIEAKAWQAHRDELFRFVLSQVHDPSTAEDIVQDVFVKAYARQTALNEPSKLRSWLYQITRNAMIDYYRLQKPSEAVPDDLVDEGEMQEDVNAQLALARCLTPLLDGLPEPYRQALRLVECEGITQRELAVRLGLSPSGAKSRVQRARTMLRDILVQRCQVGLDCRGRVVGYEARQACDGCSCPSAM